VLNVYEAMGDFADVIAGSVTPSFRPSPSGGVSGVSGMDDEDNFPGLSSPKAASMRETAAAGQKPTDDGGYYGKRVRNASDTMGQGSDEGIFIPDALTGTPLDPFDMDALRRHTQRQLALMHEPAVKFAASVAQKIGKEPDSMLVNGGTLFDPHAPNVRAMFTSSPLTQAAASQAVAQAIAQAVVELLQQSGRRTSEGEAVVKMQKMKVETRMDPINHAIDTVYEHIGVRPAYQQAVRDLGRQPPAAGGGGAAAPDAGLPVTSILRQVALFLTEVKEDNPAARWVWNSLPENSGIAIIRADVVAAMEDCHAMIREHIPDVQMWHLITGAHVRGQFAKMVAECINEAPGELQFPTYQSTRGPNVLTGSRISAGKFREERAVQRVRYLKRWFSNVSYGPSESWTYIQGQPFVARSRLAEARSNVNKWLELCAKNVNALWNELLRSAGQVDAAYSDAVKDHAEAKRALAEAEEEKVLADMNYQQGLADGVIEAEREIRADAARDAQTNVSYSRYFLQKAVKEFHNVATGGLRKRLGVEAEEVYGLVTAFSDKDEQAIISSSNALGTVLGDVVTRFSLYADSDSDTTMLLELLTNVNSLKQAIAAVKDAQKALVKAEKDVVMFPEADKRELFHHVPAPSPSRPALLSYGTPASGMYASW
jgi:hypothetical protein